VTGGDEMPKLPSVSSSAAHEVPEAPEIPKSSNVYVALVRFPVTVIPGSDVGLPSRVLRSGFGAVASLQAAIKITAAERETRRFTRIS
jgi:hypothetical protein